MERRAFVTVLVQGVLGPQLSVRAQQTAKRRIGFLSSAKSPGAGLSEPATMPLRELGWVEGQNLTVERRYASGKLELLAPMVEELVRLNVEMIVANGTVASLAAKRGTTSVPIIIDRSGDPVGAGLVTSLAHPGANITGISTMSPELEVKRLELLRELLPSATRFGVLVNPANPIDQLTHENIEQAFRSLQMSPIFVEVSVESALESAIAKVAREGGQGLIVDADPLFARNYELIARAADRHQLPLMIELRGWLRSGGLVSYGPNQAQLQRELAIMIDKVLKGAKPADLPVVQPTKFDLAISLRSARALGIAVPKSVLLRADEVIE
jgi:putative ABC transport system substrate-binding protein